MCLYIFLLEEFSNEDNKKAIIIIEQGIFIVSKKYEAILYFPLLFPLQTDFNENKYSLTTYRSETTELTL